MIVASECADEWLGKHGFLRFYEEMGPRPSPRHQIDRKNNILVTAGAIAVGRPCVSRRKTETTMSLLNSVMNVR